MKRVVIMALLTNLLFGDYLLSKGEKLLFGFRCKNNKILSIALGANNSYMIYRFGREGHIEMIYPKDKKNSFSHFSFYHYFRPAFANNENEGMDLSYLKFKNNGYLYIVYDEYYANNDSEDIGVKVMKDKKIIVNIKGILKSKRGDLSNIEYLIEDGLPIKDYSN